MTETTPAVEMEMAPEKVSQRGGTKHICDVSTFAGLSGDRHPLHTDEPYASQTQFGAPNRLRIVDVQHRGRSGGTVGILGEAMAALHRSCRSARSSRSVPPTPCKCGRRSWPPSRGASRIRQSCPSTIRRSTSATKQ